MQSDPKNGHLNTQRCIFDNFDPPPFEKPLKTSFLVPQSDACGSFLVQERPLLSSAPPSRWRDPAFIQRAPAYHARVDLQTTQRTKGSRLKKTRKCLNKISKPGGRGTSSPNLHKLGWNGGAGFVAGGVFSTVA